MPPRCPIRSKLGYDEIPGMPVPAVEGHGGVLVSAMANGYPVLAFTGRVHAYEGWDLAEVVFGVRAAVLAGCRTVVLTNAAGGIGEGLSPGDLVVIRDHLNLTGRTPLQGRNDERLGLRFPDMTEVYTAGLRQRLAETAAGLGESLGSGVYAWLLGPAYETPAEVEMARRLGADLVGMSTVPEAIAARHMGARVVGISLVTNLAAGMSANPLSHDEVQETATAAQGAVHAAARRRPPRPRPLISDTEHLIEPDSRRRRLPPHAGWTEPHLGRTTHRWCSGGSPRTTHRCWRRRPPVAR